MPVSIDRAGRRSHASATEPWERPPDGSHFGGEFREPDLGARACEALDVYLHLLTRFFRVSA
jgi:hypothetical protein